MSMTPQTAEAEISNGSGLLQMTTGNPDLRGDRVSLACGGMALLERMQHASSPMGVVVQAKPGRVPRYKRYLHEML